VLICRSGNRSVDAGEALEAAGFSDVYNVLEGFEGISTTTIIAARRVAGGSRVAMGAVLHDPVKRSIRMSRIRAPHGLAVTSIQAACGFVIRCVVS
jgi:hypothetical protein